jgi:hypothetical protein
MVTTAKERIWLQRFALIVIYYVVAAAAFSGVFAKWAFREDTPSIKLVSILDGTAKRPYVYRQLLPTIANGLDRVVPERFKPALTPSPHLESIYAKATDAANPKYEFRYHLVYGLGFLSLFLSLFVLRDVCRQLLGPGIGASIAPPIFALFLPFIMTVGNHYYDMTELLLLSVSVWVCVRRWAYVLPVLAVVATFNKESYFFFIPALYPLLRMHYSKAVTLWLAGTSAALAVAVNLAVKHAFRANPGGAVEAYFVLSLRTYTHWRSYLQFELTYGLPGPANLSAIAIALVAAVTALGWPAMPKALRQHIAIAALINLPLWLLLCYPGELRNFSLLFVGGVCLICGALKASQA